MIAGRKARGKSMLARAVMPVVIVLAQPITLGIWEHMTAELHPKPQGTDET